MAAVKLKIRVQPGARRSEIVGWQGDTLRVWVQAPPIEGRANLALVELLSEVLRLPKSLIVVRAGRSSRVKLVQVEGISEEELRGRLPEQPGPGA